MLVAADDVEYVFGVTYTPAGDALAEVLSDKEILLEFTAIIVESADFLFPGSGRVAHLEYWELPSLFVVVAGGIHKELEAVTRLLEETPESYGKQLTQHEVNIAKNQIPSLLIEVPTIWCINVHSLSYFYSKGNYDQKWDWQKLHMNYLL